jgi:hypothetical protein
MECGSPLPLWRGERRDRERRDCKRGSGRWRWKDVGRCGKRQGAAAVQRACGVRWPSTALDSAGAGGTGVGVPGWGAKEARRKAALGREPAVATLAWLCLGFPGLLTAQEVVEIIPITRVRVHYFIPAEDGNGKSCGVQLHGTWPVYKNYTNLSSYIVCVGRSEPGWRPSPRCCTSSGATASPERNTQRPRPLNAGGVVAARQPRPTHSGRTAPGERNSRC